MSWMLLLANLFVLPAGAQAPEAPAIRNFLRVNSEFCTGGQPSPEHFLKLKSDGVKAVLNLRPPSEHQAEEEERVVRNLGLKYFNIPVAYRDPKAEDADAFLKITDDPSNRPMFIHCAAAVRVGAFWLVRRVLRDGWTWDNALAEARKVGLNAPHLEEFARQYIASHQPGVSSR